MNLILIGFKNSGKSFFGKKLAEKLNLPFIDIDLEIERYASNQKSCRDLFFELGEKAFRILEQNMIAKFFKASGHIIAFGGGTKLSKRLLESFHRDTKVVFLSADKLMLKQRILSQKQLPAFFKAKDFEENFETLYKERLSDYEYFADKTIQTDGKQEELIIEELKQLYTQVKNHG